MKITFEFSAPEIGLAMHALQKYANEAFGKPRQRARAVALLNKLNDACKEHEAKAREMDDAMRPKSLTATAR